MVDIVISAAIIVLIMLLFVFVLLKNIILRIGQNAKRYFVNKLEEYDYIVEEKEKQIDELTEEIKKLLKNKAELERYKMVSVPKKKLQEQNTTYSQSNYQIWNCNTVKSPPVVLIWATTINPYSG